MEPQKSPGKTAASEVIVCASSAAMAMAFDAGGRQRQKDIWVGDLTDDEAERLLIHRGVSPGCIALSREGLHALLVSGCP